MIGENTYFQLKEKIESLRKKMIERGMKKGFQDQETLFFSKELDKLIYHYQMKSMN
ncbi:MULTISPECIES: aspartyl-phosphate phosphatase Spo0E family protein [Heyndrickxia]|jgi:hypothetical protein|uniref:Aspartyl-phosphate phosphatase Spo0E family protein n=1 Tax=Heyndrickxia oleronia TaxID=38875 RepID=A0AAW6STZ0_9BACI|nr:aspartyl-phosphate phosphatase Spo0E family protein [Heyndrickxia oleronia]NYV65286.1 aspartyl-phosphate phosphatase Spo0E family protein [Bacillus sp. Gen3]MBU5212981.1 aspartyl-phosphate phosphatase Spo0E family protein [Heyndrickxia oleronia]MCI1589878.1 aspartyl-phosphate phosphatase Spo0E family protein [Heyndrickxia oleronia]MCI1611589.1 aspartyl-phosphate phosphatase Spo0E family protein [Heyndrickxia oleronia]MCI1743504.1 aspartyl-phosphate phosphatase Spo0E family protein [Heyndric